MIGCLLAADFKKMKDYSMAENCSVIVLKRNYLRMETKIEYYQ